MAKIDISRVLLELDGTPVMQTKRVEVNTVYGPQVQEVKTDKKQTVKDIIVVICYTPNNDLTPEEKGRLYDIALKVQEASRKKSIVILTAEDVTLLKKLAGKYFPPITYGQMIQALEEGNKFPTPDPVEDVETNESVNKQESTTSEADAKQQEA